MLNTNNSISVLGSLILIPVSPIFQLFMKAKRAWINNHALLF